MLLFFDFILLRLFLPGHAFSFSRERPHCIISLNKITYDLPYNIIYIVFTVNISVFCNSVNSIKSISKHFIYSANKRPVFLKKSKFFCFERFFFVFSEKIPSSSLARGNKPQFQPGRISMGKIGQNAVIGVLFICLCVSGALVYMKWQAKSRLKKAQSDCVLIANAIEAFKKDMRVFPAVTAPGGPSRLVAKGQKIPAFAPESRWEFYAGGTDSFDNYLAANHPWGDSKYAYADTASAKWHGPYLNSFLPDPWGNSYVYCYSPFSGKFYILSGGKDGVIQTTRYSKDVDPRDLGVILSY
jgi:hypothetical protein